MEREWSLIFQLMINPYPVWHSIQVVSIHIYSVLLSLSKAPKTAHLLKLTILYLRLLVSVYAHMVESVKMAKSTTEACQCL